MTKRDSMKAELLRRAEEARHEAAKATDPKAKIELMRPGEMWERLARAHQGPETEDNGDQ